MPTFTGAFFPPSVPVLGALPVLAVLVFAVWPVRVVGVLVLFALAFAVDGGFGVDTA